MEIILGSSAKSLLCVDDGVGKLGDEGREGSNRSSAWYGRGGH